MKFKLPAAAAVGFAVLAGALVSAPAARADWLDPLKLIGSWKVTINVANPPGFPSFPVMMTIHADGTVLSSRLGYTPQFPAGSLIQGTGHGAWNVQRGQAYATFETLVQGAPGSAIPNGAFFAIEKVKFQPAPSADGNSFSGNWTSAYLDPNTGATLLQGGGTLTAVRVQPEQ